MGQSRPRKSLAGRELVAKDFTKLSRQEKESNGSLMICAKQDVRSNRLVTAKRYNVPRATLYRLCNKEGSPDTVCSTTLGRKTALPPEF
ncbi:unnamed protein product [Acanthoscelides obtectus]|uniref:HTH psq-type domain-containing protein n=1 Tax=Acanthoscelides obtectus TaxID=200917 RepID=A0A9P0JUK0_ACAOB|nr:unnamed protein product [Acanthoscelides obtectus]CAK1647926.1 hypothetical protein AOBTE_LOCUS15458 [Acanthoscelides obtectus]